MKIAQWAKWLFLVLFGFQAGAGISVGNFSFKTQTEFDFRIGFPNTWRWEPQTPSAENETERWYLSNGAKVAEAAHVSSATVSFLRNFPATNDDELLTELRRLYPSRTWSKLNNRVTVGFQSDKELIAPARWRNYEYYFSGKQKVVRIESIYDDVGDGSVELATILSTIRRPSGAPVLTKMNTTTKAPVKVGDLFCYQMEVDLQKNDFDRDSLIAFELVDTLPFWSFKSVVWDRATSSIKVCSRVNERFSSNGLRIKNLTLSSNNTSLVCRDAETPAPNLLCGANQTPIPYEIPKVENPRPVRKAPQITSIQSANTANAIRVGVSSEIPLIIGEMTIETSSGNSGFDSQIIYPDQLGSSTVEVAYEQGRLPRGPTRVIGLSLTDKVGNTVQLKAENNSGTYTRYSSDGPPVPTDLKVVRVVGESK